MEDQTEGEKKCLKDDRYKGLLTYRKVHVMKDLNRAGGLPEGEVCV